MATKMATVIVKRGKFKYRFNVIPPKDLKTYLLYLNICFSNVLEALHTNVLEALHTNVLEALHTNVT